MEAREYDPQGITVTPAALAHVRRQLRSEGAAALVLGVTESGCNGYMYELDFVSEAIAETASGVASGAVSGADSGSPTVRSFRFGDDVRVDVAEDDWPLVRGTEIDYVVEGLNSALKFNNPNADAMCGCGESFSIRS